MKKSTGVILRLTVVVSILALLGAALYVIVKMTNLNEFEHTRNGRQAFEKAEKLFEDAKTAAGEGRLADAEAAEQEAWEALEKAKESFKNAINVELRYFPAHNGLGKCYVLEAENSLNDRRKSAEAFHKADKEFAEAMKYCRWHMGAAIERCKIYDKYFYDPVTVSKLAERALRAQEAKKQADPEYAATDVESKKALENELRYYLAKGTVGAARKESQRLIPGIGGADLSTQDRMLAYAQVTAAFQDAVKVYEDLAKETKLPEELTLRDIYLEVGKIYLRMIDTIWQVYQGKPIPEIDLKTMEPAKAARTKGILAKIGVLDDPSTLRYTELHSVLANLRDEAKEHFDQAIKVSDEKTMEETVLEIGKGRCLYGVSPMGPRPAELPGEQILRNAMKDDSIHKTETFYTGYAQLLMRLRKTEEAGKVLKEGLEKLESPAMHLELGKYYEQDGRLEDAREQIEAALQKDKDNKDVRHELVLLYLAIAGQGEKEILKDAREHLARLMREDPENGDYLILRGRIDLADEKYEDARKSFMEVYEKGPQWRLAGAYHLAMLYQARGDMATAEEYLNKAKESGTRPNAEVYRRLAQLLYGRGEIKRAQQVCEEYVERSENLNLPMQPPVLKIMADCQEAIGDKEGAAKTYVKLINSGGNRNRYTMLMGYMWLRGVTTNLEIEQARKCFEHVAESEASYPAWEKTLGVYYGLARCEIAGKRANRYAAAIAILEQRVWPLLQEIKRHATTDDAREDYVNKYKAYLLHLFDYYSEVTPLSPTDKEELNRIARELHDIAPEDPRAFRRYLKAQTLDLPADEAAKREKEIIRQDLENSRSDEEKNKIKFLYAETLLGRGSLEDAKKWYKQVQVPEDDKGDMGLRVYMNLANICINTEDFGEAEGYIKTLKAKYADRPETALVEATYNAMKEKDIVKRIAVLKSAMEEHPDIAELHKSLGDAYMKAAMFGEKGVDPVDRYRSAILEFNKVLDVSRGRMDIYHRLAVVHTNLGGILTRAGRMRKAAEEYAKSRKILAKLLEIAPEKALYLRLLAEAEDAGGNSEKAVKLYEQSAAIREKQVEQTENKPEEDSAGEAYKRELSLVYKRLIRLYSDMQRNDKAAEMAQKMKALALATTAREILTLDVTEAIIAERNGDYDKARKILETAFDKEEIRKDKQQHMQLILQMSRFYQRRRNAAATDEERKKYREKREQILNKGIELYPDSTQMYIWKAEMYISEGQSGKAGELVDLAVEKANAVDDEDKDIMVYASAGSFYERQARTRKELRKAENLLLEAVRLASDRQSDELLYRERLLGFYFRHMGVFKDKARNYVADLLRREPENPHYLVFNGRLKALTGDPRGAVEQFKKATEIDPMLDTAYVQWADAIFEESPDGINEAIEVVERGLEENDGSIALRNALGRFCMIKKEYDKARECFRKVLAVNGRDFTALDAVARLSLKALADPRVDYKDALKDAEAAVNALYRYYPDAPATYRVLGFLELHQGSPEKAVGHFKQAYALGNDPVSLRALSNLCLGRQAVSFDPRNLEIWAKTLPRWKYNTAVQMFIGRCMLKERRDGAENFFRSVAESADNPAEPYLFTDIYYLDRHRASTAKKYFNKCLERMDKSVAETADFAKLYVEAGHPRRAIELIERVSENIGEKDRPELDAARAYVYLFELDDAEKAEKIIRPVIESDLKPKPAAALCVIGKIMCDRDGEEFEQGLEYIKSAVRAEPSAPSYYCALAEAYYKSYMKNGRKADMRAALAAIENTMRMDPNYYMLPNLHLWRGDMYYKDGDKEKAREDYRKYLDLGGKERAEEVGKRLEE